jgi:hypothetical protein
MWGRFGRKRTGRTENVLWRRVGRLRTQPAGLGIGVLALLTIVSLAVWLLRRRAGETEAAPPEEG